MRARKGKRMIKLFDPHISRDEIKAASNVLRSKNWASGAGLNKVKEFEEKFRSYLDCDEVVALNSGTAALHLALSLLDIRGKDIFVPSLTFVSTAHSSLYNGGNVVFVDVDPETLCMDARDLQKKVSKSGQNAAAIVPVHFGGMPCNMKEINRIAQQYNLTVVDDAAHACGTTYDNKKVGSYQTMTCFSFHPVKNLAMPTGGAISINNKHSQLMKRRLNSQRWCGIDDRRGTSYDVTSVAPNYYMNEISAAIGLVQLRKLDRLNAGRRKIAKRYSSEIDVEFKMPYSEDCVYHLYWFVHEKREKLIAHLNSRGIEVGTHYRPVHTMSAYKNKAAGASVPVTEDVGKKIITIPIHPNLSDDDISYIIESLNSFR
jgi:dTDP-4-amino-4,6-dideoxygalactose transaminase